MRMQNSIVGCIVASLLVVGCGDTIKPGSFIDKARVLGVRYEVQGDPGRAWPQRGEALDVSFIVVSPEDLPSASAAVVACKAGTSPGGFAGCDGPPVALAANPAPMQVEGNQIQTVLQIPTDLADDIKSLLVFSLFCYDGDINTSLDGLMSGMSACVDPMKKGEIGFFTIPITDTPPNQIPEIDFVELADSLWRTAAPTEQVGCAGIDGLPSAELIPGDTEQQAEAAIRLHATTGSVETFTVMEGMPPMSVERLEALQISLFTTAGEFTRQFAFIDAEGDVADIKWRLPPAEEVPAEGLLVRMYFVMRDLRGGVDWTSRALCVVPPS